MGRKRNRKQSPLFYINQPNIEFPQPNMQKSFNYKDDEIVEDEVLPEDNIVTDEVEGHAESAEIIENEEVKKKKNFHDYTIEEKIRHLKLVPAAVAKLKYEFVTVGRTYKGYFMSMEGGALMIHSISPRKKSVSIPVEDLVDIKRLGL
ncbi:hypothetical protein DYI25_01565 [Mesobacillus boroniphilus]|uniref:Spore coat protein CotO n=1 Tax=Mesobacillus boroniphilus TaxID=308892 RepID=A0A944GW82_9BACI|nr:CotO family spore coat protein [Mesobacillus boroniphilus]MBS8263121.1 hypothetical protein [Mesobacillus boroniphilus]